MIYPLHLTPNHHSISSFFAGAMLCLLSLALQGQEALSKTQLLDQFLDRRLPDEIRLEAAVELQTRYVRLTPDSLLWMNQQILSNKSDSQKPDWEIMTLLGQGRYFIMHSRMDSAYLLYSRGLEKLGNTTSNYVKSVLYGGIGFLEYIYKGNPKLALQYFAKARSYLKPGKDDSRLCNLYMYEGVIALDQGNFFVALTTLQTALELAEKTNKSSEKGEILTNLGVILVNLHLQKEAQKNLLQALAIHEKNGDFRAVAHTYSYLILAADDLAMAKRYYEKGIKISTAHGFDLVRTAIHHDFGLVLLEQGQADSAFHQFQRCLQTSKKVGERRYMTIATAQLNRIKLKKSPSLIKIKELENLIPSLMNINEALLQEVYHSLNEAYHAIGRLDKAYFYLSKEFDSQKNKDKERMVREVIEQYFVDKAERDKTMLDLENERVAQKMNEKARRQNLLITALGVILLLLSVISYGIYRISQIHRKNAEKLLSINLAMEATQADLIRSNERLKRFSAVVSHDILSNLDLVLSAGNVLVTKQAPKASFNQYYDIAQRTSRQLKDYCLGLLEEARSTVGKIERISSPMPVVQEVLARQEIALLNKGCKVQVEDLAPTLLPLSIVGQVFQNLVSNAIRYGLDAPSPLLRIAEEQDPLRGTTRWVVEDNGKGVPPALREAIFDKTTTEGIESQGQNLGLRLLRETLKSYGAKIWVEDRVGGGARFVVDLGMREELLG